MILQPVEHPEFFGGKRREGESLEMLTLTSIDTNLGAQSLPSLNPPQSP